MAVLCSGRGAVALAAAALLLLCAAAATATAAAADRAAEAALLRGLFPAPEAVRRSADGRLSYEFEHRDARGRRTHLRYEARTSADVVDLTTFGVARVSCAADDARVDVHLRDAGEAARLRAALREGAVLAGGASVLCEGRGPAEEKESAPRAGERAPVLHRVTALLPEARDDAADALVVSVATRRAAQREALETARIEFVCGDAALLKRALGARWSILGSIESAASSVVSGVESAASDVVGSVTSAYNIAEAVATILETGQFTGNEDVPIASWNYNQQTQSPTVSSYPIYSGQAQSSDGTASANVEVTCHNCYMSIDLGLDLSLSFSASDVSASLSGTLSAQASADLVVNADGSFNDQWSVSLVDLTQVLSNQLIFTVGPVPIYVSISFGLNALASVQSSASLVATAGFDTTASFTRGVQCDCGTLASVSSLSCNPGCSVITSQAGAPVDAFNMHPPSVTLQGSAQFVVSLVPTFQIVVESVATGGISPVLSLVNTLTGNYDSSSSNNGCELSYEGYLQISGSAFASLGISIAEWSLSTPQKMFQLPTFGPFLDTTSCLVGSSSGKRAAGAPLAPAPSADALIAAWNAKLAPRDPVVARMLGAAPLNVERTIRAMTAPQSSSSSSASSSSAPARGLLHFDAAVSAPVTTHVAGSNGRAAAPAASCSCASGTLALDTPVTIDTCAASPLNGLQLMCSNGNSLATQALTLTLAPGSYVISAQPSASAPASGVAPVLNLRASDCCGTLLACSDALAASAQGQSIALVVPATATYVLYVGADASDACGAVDVLVSASTSIAVFVDNASGDDSNSGTYAMPLASLQGAFALVASLFGAAPSETAATIYIMPNLYNSDPSQQYMYPPAGGYTLPASLAGKQLTISSLNKRGAPELLVAWQQYTDGVISSTQLFAMTFGTSFDTQLGCAGSPCRAFSLSGVSGVTLQGLWFDSFTTDASSGAGAAVVLNGASATLSNCFFWASSASAQNAGGDIAALGASTLTIYDTVSLNARSDLGGSAVYVAGTSSVYAMRSVFRSASSSRGSGGAVQVNGGSFFAMQCTFEQNTARYGGAVATLGGTSLLMSSKFTLNSAVYTGGALAAFGGVTRTVACTMTRNNAGTMGGAVHTQGSSAIYGDSSSLISGNSAPAVAVTSGGSVLLQKTRVYAGGSVPNSLNYPTNLSTSLPGNMYCANSFADVSAASISQAQLPDGTLIANTLCSSCTGSCTSCSVCSSCGHCDATTGACSTATSDGFCASLLGASGACSPLSGSCWVASRSLAGMCPTADAPSGSLSPGAVAAVSSVSTAVVAVLLSSIVTAAICARRQRRRATLTAVPAQRLSSPLLAHDAL